MRVSLDRQLPRRRWLLAASATVALGGAIGAGCATGHFASSEGGGGASGESEASSGIANVSRFRSSQSVDAFGLRCATPKLLF